MDLLARIDHWGQASPERAAHESDGRILTYGELVAASDRLAAYLSATLPADGSPIAVLGHKEPEMLIAFLGAVKAGHPYIPLDSSLPAQRIERIQAVAATPLTLTPAAVAAILQQNTLPAGPAPQRVGPADPYYIIFTSGSTGEPKGVVITLGCLTSYVEWMLQTVAFREHEERFLNQAPFSFDLSVMDLYLSLATGGTLVSVTKEAVANPRRLYELFGQSGVTVWVSTPSFAQMSLAERSFGESMLPGLRCFLFCGETLATDVAAALLDRFPQAEVWNTYGPTEATVCTTAVRVDRAVLQRYSPLPVGSPKPDTRILTVDEGGDPVAEGERGEIVIAGPNVSTGYLGRPDLTARAFYRVEGMRAYRTGDWGRFQDGLLFFEGRMDNQVKLHGYRIELGDVEAHLQRLPGVRDAVVLPVMKEGKAESLAAFVVVTDRPEGATDFQVAQNLRSALAAQLPAYMLPRKFFFRDAFPMTVNGKADRRKLAEEFK